MGCAPRGAPNPDFAGVDTSATADGTADGGGRRRTTTVTVTNSEEELEKMFWLLIPT